jgi:hypothetical protein
MDGLQPAEQEDIIWGAVEGMYVPQITPMLRRCIIVGTKEPGARTTFVQCNPGILGVAGKLLSLQE